MYINANILHIIRKNILQVYNSMKIRFYLQ